MGDVELTGQSLCSRAGPNQHVCHVAVRAAHACAHVRPKLLERCLAALPLIPGLPCLFLPCSHHHRTFFFLPAKMKFLGQSSILAATALAFSALRTASAEDAASDVLSLTQDTFATTVDGEVSAREQKGLLVTDAIFRQALMLVEFFAPWCGHCQARTCGEEDVGLVRLTHAALHSGTAVRGGCDDAEE